jgi:hypothetical protein
MALSFLNRGLGRQLLDALGCAAGTGLGRVALRDHDDLAVAGNQAEAPLACVIRVELKATHSLGRYGRWRTSHRSRWASLVTGTTGVEPRSPASADLRPKLSPVLVSLRRPATLPLVSLIRACPD